MPNVRRKSITHAIINDGVVQVVCMVINPFVFLLRIKVMITKVTVNRSSRFRWNVSHGFIYNFLSSLKTCMFWWTYLRSEFSTWCVHSCHSQVIVENHLMYLQICVLYHFIYPEMDQTREAWGRSPLACGENRPCCLLSQLWRGGPSTADHWGNREESLYPEGCMDLGHEIWKVEGGEQGCVIWRVLLHK